MHKKIDSSEAHDDTLVVMQSASQLVYQRFLQLSQTRVLYSFLGVIFISCLVTLYHYRSFRGSGLPPNLDVNIECGPCVPKDALPEYCNLPEELQFTKFIWFITDGWPYNVANESLAIYQDHSIEFSTVVYGNKWSHTIYTSWFTGLPSTNLFGDVIRGDQLFESFLRASASDSHSNVCSNSISYHEDLSKVENPFKINYVGTDWAPVYLVGGAEVCITRFRFDEVNIIDETFSDPHVYPTITLPSLQEETGTKENENAQSIEVVLSEMSRKNQSLIIHSGLFDKSVHYASQRLNRETAALNFLFGDGKLKNFVDSHPEYLLMISSDHGRSKKGSTFHGDQYYNMNNGNVGFFVFYSPKLAPQARQEIDVVDILPTISKYLRGVDIPYHSTGMVQNSFRLSKQASLAYKGENEWTLGDTVYFKEAETNAFKQNLVQLKRAAMYKGLSLDYSTIQEVLERGTEDSIRNYVMQIKEALYHPAFPVYLLTMTLFGALGSSALFYWLYANRDLTVFRTIILYVPMFGLFGFVWWLFKPRYWDTREFFKLWQLPYLAITMCIEFWNLGRSHRAQHLVMNEVIMWLNEKLQYYLKDYIKNNLLFAVLGVVLSMYHTQTKTPLESSKKYQIVHLLLALFLLTKDAELYFVAGFHCIAILVYAGIGVLFVNCIYRRKLDEIYLPVLLLLLTLRNGDLTIIVFVYQFHRFVPLLLSDYSSTAQGYEAAAIYSYVQVFWFFNEVMQYTLDWEVEPIYGAVGVISWNLYPTFSGFCMVYAKYGIFILSAVLVSSTVKDCFLLVFMSAQVFQLGLVSHWVIAVYTQGHALDSCLTMMLLCATNCAIFILFKLGETTEGSLSSKSENWISFGRRKSATQDLKNV